MPKVSLINRIGYFSFRVLRKILATFLQYLYQPAGYFRYWRYRNIKGGTLKHARISDIKPFVSSSIAICACYPAKLDLTLLMQLRDLSQTGFDILLVANGCLTPEQMTAYSAHICKLIERPNVGRDFGAYRDGYVYLEQIDQLEDIEELLFINDTIVFPLFDSSGFWEKLKALPYAVTGPFENFRNGRHLQSFMLLLRNGAPAHPAVRAFWKNYKPVDTRRHAIRKGEQGFSEALRRADIRFGPLCDAYFLIDLIPVQFDAEWLHCAMELLNITDEDDILNLPIEGQRSFLRRELGRRHTMTNLSHSVGLFLAVCNAVPMLKKDLFSRGSAKPTDLWWLKNIAPEKRLQFLEALKEKRLPQERTLWEWIETDFLQIK